MVENKEVEINKLNKYYKTSNYKFKIENNKLKIDTIFKHKIDKEFNLKDI